MSPLNTTFVYTLTLAMKYILDQLEKNIYDTWKIAQFFSVEGKFIVEPD